MINWERTYTRLGYESEVDFWTDLYCKKGFSIAALATKLDVSRNTVRSALERLKIEIRKQGGPNNQKLAEVDGAIIEEIKKDGIAAVAKRLGLSYTTIYKRYRIYTLKVSDLHPDDAKRITDEEDKL